MFERTKTNKRNLEKKNSEGDHICKDVRPQFKKITDKPGDLRTVIVALGDN